MIKRVIRDFLNKVVSMRHHTLRIAKGCNVASSVFEGYNRFSQKTDFIASEIGLCSYIGEHCHFSHAKIGRFCSIGSYVRMSIGNHPSKDWVSTHPVFFSTAKQSGLSFTDKSRFEEKVFADKDRYIVIGNDVWIGDNVVLLPGIKISDGAIIATGSVVTKDVEPYSIVGGNPAKIIRYRFNEEDREFLLSLKWWDKDINWLRDNAFYFNNLNNLKRHFNENINSCQ